MFETKGTGSHLVIAVKYSVRNICKDRFGINGPMDVMIHFKSFSYYLEP